MQSSRSSFSQTSYFLNKRMSSKKFPWSTVSPSNVYTASFFLCLWLSPHFPRTFTTPTTHSNTWRLFFTCSLWAYIWLSANMMFISALEHRSENASAQVRCAMLFPCSSVHWCTCIQSDRYPCKSHTHKTKQYMTSLTILLLTQWSNQVQNYEKEAHSCISITYRQWTII